MILTSIGECVETVRSWNPVRDAADQNIDYVDLGAVDNEQKIVVGAQRVLGKEAPSRARQKVLAGDIVVSTVRPYLNGVARIPDHLDGATASTGFCVLRASSDKIDPAYLFHWVKTPTFVADMIRKSTGASYPAVSDRIILESLAPVPSLTEQRRIAAILDQADALRCLRRQSLSRLGDLRQAVFHEMFGHYVGSFRPLGDLTCKIGSGATPTGGNASYQASGIPFVRSMNVRDGAFDDNGLAFLSDSQADKLNNVTLVEDDVLINITGASVARVCRAPQHVAGGRVNQHVSIIRLTGGLLPSFLEAYLMQPQIKRRLLNIAEAGATRQAITKFQLEQFEVPAPAMKEQQLFESRLRQTAELHAFSSKSLFALDKQFASLQHRAFRGEL